MNKPLHFAPLVVWQQGRVGLGAGPAAQSKQRVRVGAVECRGRAAAGDTVCGAGLDSHDLRQVLGRCNQLS